MFKHVPKGNCNLLHMSISHPSILILHPISLYLILQLKASHFDDLVSLTLISILDMLILKGFCWMDDRYAHMQLFPRT